MTDKECSLVLREHFSWVDPLRTHEVSYEKLTAAIERAIELLEYPDGRFDTRYLCTKGHHVVSKRPDLDTCSAELPWPRTEATTVCGAQLSVYQEDFDDV